MIPCDAVGGDYLDFLTGDDFAGRGFGVAVGDVTGHGPAAALLMTAARACLRMRASRPGGLGEVVTDMNRHLAVDLGDVERFMTFYLLEVRGDAVSWVSAGHEPALLVDPGVGDDRRPGGGRPGPRHRRGHHVPRAPGPVPRAGSGPGPVYGRDHGGLERERRAIRPRAAQAEPAATRPSGRRRDPRRRDARRPRLPRSRAAEGRPDPGRPEADPLNRRHRGPSLLFAPLPILSANSSWPSKAGGMASQALPYHPDSGVRASSGNSPTVSTAIEKPRTPVSVKIVVFCSYRRSVVMQSRLLQGDRKSLRDRPFRLIEP